MRVRRAHRPGEYRSLRHGRTGAEPLVLIHPFTTNAHIWRGVAQELADEFDILMVTLPGHHGGDRPDRGGMSLPRLVDHVETQMDEAGFDSAHVAGNSLGGWISLELGKRDRARSVTAIAPAGGWGRVDLRRTLPLAAKFLSIAPIAAVGPVLGPVAHLPIGHRIMLGLVAGDARAVERADAQAMMAASMNCSGYLKLLLGGGRHGGMRDHDLISAPVRLVLCERDRIIPPKIYGALYEQLIPEVDTLTLPGVGHVPMLEAPELVADVIAEHALASVQATRRTA